MPKNAGSLRRFSTLLLAISKTSVSLYVTSGWLRRRWALLGEYALAVEDRVPDRLGARLREIVTQASCAGMLTRVVLADEWGRLWVVKPPQNAARLQDCESAAKMRFHALYGDSSAEWKISADWDARHPFLACAVPLSLLNALEQAGRECSLRLVSILPHFVAGWNRWRKNIKQNAWFSSVHGTNLTLGLVARRRVGRYAAWFCRLLTGKTAAGSRCSWLRSCSAAPRKRSCWRLGRNSGAP